MSATNYNPIIDSSITISCNVTDLFGNAINGKTLTLYQNGTSKGTATTNSNGTATWTVTMSDWGVQHFRVENKSIDVRVTGWKQVESKLSGVVTVHRNEDTVQLALEGSVTLTANDTKTIATISSTYAPMNYISTVFHYTSNQVTCFINPNGDIQVRNSTNSTSLIARVIITYALVEKIKT